MKLRDALGDYADKKLYIETIRKRGYRFVATVSQAGDYASEMPKTEAPATDSGTQRHRPLHR